MTIIVFQLFSGQYFQNRQSEELRVPCEEKKIKTQENY